MLAELCSNHQYSISRIFSSPQKTQTHHHAHIYLSHHTSSRAEILPWTHPLHGPYITVYKAVHSESLLEVLAGKNNCSCMPLDRGPVLLYWGWLSSTEHAALGGIGRERWERKGDTHLASQISQITLVINEAQTAKTRSFPRDVSILDAHTNKTIQYMLACVWHSHSSKAFSTL